MLSATAMNTQRIHCVDGWHACADHMTSQVCAAIEAHSIFHIYIWCLWACVVNLLHIGILQWLYGRIRRTKQHVICALMWSMNAFYYACRRHNVLPVKMVDAAQRNHEIFHLVFYFLFIRINYLFLHSSTSAHNVRAAFASWKILLAFKRTTL